MRKSPLALMLMVLLVCSWAEAQAQPHAGKKRQFRRMVVDGLIYGMTVAAVAADAQSTIYVLRRCRGCAEENPILGSRPSNVRVIVTYGAIAAAYVLVERWVEKGSAWPWHALPAAVAIVGHGLAAKQNYGVRLGKDPRSVQDAVARPKCPSGTVCR